MTEFLGELGLKYSRSGMPGLKALNGPQIDKIWRNLDLLHKKLMDKGVGVLGDGAVDYIRKLQALYLMCARYLKFCIHTNKLFNCIFQQNTAPGLCENDPGLQGRLRPYVFFGVSLRDPKDSYPLQPLGDLPRHPGQREQVDAGPGRLPGIRGMSFRPEKE